MKIKILSNRQELITKTVELLITRINNHTTSQPFVLGLSTGATVLSICEELVKHYQAGDISLKNVITFHAGEYIGFSYISKQKYFKILQESFFSKVDIPTQNIFTIDGSTSDIMLECQHYEQKIKEFGGMDLFLGSLGENGNIAFNEPGSSLVSRTRIKTLTMETKRADARFFDNDINLVPSQAITMGLGTIFDAKEIIITVYGFQKAFTIQKCLEQSISDMNPASILQMHENVRFFIDKVAGRFLNLTIL